MITYPRTFPFSGNIFGSGSMLVLSRGDARNRDGAGMLEVMELADPLWALNIVTRPLRPSQRATWKAWALSLQGGIQLFYGYPPIQQYPLLYGATVLGLTRAGGGAFDGTVTVTAASGFAMALSGLPASYTATAGDHISVVLSNGSRMLHMITETVGANVSGVISSLSVQPAARAETSIGSAAAQLVKPSALFVLRQETLEVPDSEVLAPVSFEAMQTVRPI